MYRISKQFYFSAAHVLSQLPESHPCSRLHGHNYTVEVVLESETLDQNSFIVDYNDLYPVKDYINSTLDHRNLNDVLPVATTAENIAKFLYDRFKPQFPQLCKVRVSETPKTWAEYEEDRR